MDRWSWIIWVDPNGDHKCPYKKETKGDLTHREENAMRWKHREIWRYYSSGLEDGGSSHEARSARNAALESG